jgi:uncharacterized protein YyaL (SSP411 family)
MPKTVLLLLAGLVAAIPAAPAAERLRGEASAFLHSFADSPVDWMPWGNEAMARARSEQRPVFVFVGAFTSELSAAMRKQTFANAKTADWLNKQFVCVLVDRDERPDVAALYEAYVANLKQLNGWPLNIWLTPDFQPFEGATYLSPSEDWGAPGFLKLASQAKAAWASGPAACRKRAADSVAQLAPPPGTPVAPAWDLQKTRARLSAAAAGWAGAFDPVHGGFGDPPRSPEPELLRFMLLQTPSDREDALKTLRALAVSAVRDPLDGGFFRHAADGAWHIPYQQKALADQARLALAFLDGAQGPDAKSFRECARGALDFALGRMANADGTFAAAEDATGEDYLNYYSWSEAEIDAALGTGSPGFKAAHGVTAGGNVPAGDDPSATFAGRNLLLSPALADPAQAGVVGKLLAVRDGRRPLPRDPRGTAGAHGLLLSALSRAGVQLAEPRYLKAAHDLLGTVGRKFVAGPDGTVRRLAGTAFPGAAEDYAALALGCRDAAQALHDKDAAALASRLLDQLAARYYDPVGHAYFGAEKPVPAGFFIRPPGAEDPPSAEALALPVRAVHATEVAAQLSESLEETSAQAPGDQLLALALFAGEGPTR